MGAARTVSFAETLAQADESLCSTRAGCGWVWSGVSAAVWVRLPDGGSQGCERV